MSSSSLWRIEIYLDNAQEYRFCLLNQRMGLSLDSNRSYKELRGVTQEVNGLLKAFSTNHIQVVRRPHGEVKA